MGRQKKKKDNESLGKAGRVFKNDGRLRKRQQPIRVIPFEK